MVKRLQLAVLALTLALAVGCSVARPEGPEPLRYRDQVFPTVNVSRDLTYGTAPDAQGNPVTLKLDLYQPAGDTVGRRPAVVWVHGGGFTTGSKSSGERWATLFAKQGYVAVSIDYRLLSATGCGGQPAPSPQCLQAALAAQYDAQAAIRWLRANADARRVDPGRVGVAGSSAGGVTSVLLATRSDDPGSSGNPGYPSTVRGAFSVSGGTPTSEFINAGDAPTYFLHGTADTTVPYSWAVGNAAAMYNLGIEVWLNPLEGVGHGLPASARPIIDEQSNYFFYRVMDLANAPR